jgi:hypothetical protein
MVKRLGRMCPGTIPVGLGRVGRADQEQGPDGLKEGRTRRKHSYWLSWVAGESVSLLQGLFPGDFGAFQGQGSTR